MTQKSNQTLALESLKAIATKARNGSYFVKRGAIVWEEFPFEKFKRAISIQVDERDFMRPTNKAECALEFAAAIPGTDQHPGIDDGLMDEFLEDAEAIFRAWRQAMDSIGTFVLGFTPGKITEFHDVDYRVQGMTAKFTAEF